MNAKQYREERDRAQARVVRLEAVARAALDVVVSALPPTQPGDDVRVVPVQPLIRLTQALNGQDDGAAPCPAVGPA